MTEARLRFENTKFKLKFSNELYTIRYLEGAPDADELLKKWTIAHEKKASILPRNKFVRWPFEQSVLRATVNSILKESWNDDMGFARVWFWLVKQEQFKGHSQDPEDQLAKFPRDSFVRIESEEILLWFWTAEKLALINFFSGKYHDDDIRREKGIIESRGVGKIRLVRPSTAVSLSNLARFRIRKYFEEREGVLFNNSWLSGTGSLTSQSIRNRILSLMNAFHRGIDEGLIPYLPIKKKRATEITLSQECTKSAHASIKGYIQTLQNAMGVIKVECKAQERKLNISLDKLKDDLKSPILELARHERIRLTADEITQYTDEILKFVDKSNDEFQRNPVITQFSSLIHNEPIPQNAVENYLIERFLTSRESLIKLSKGPKVIKANCFSIEMSKVWGVLEDRAHTVILKCSRQIRESFHESVASLQKEFNKFKKVLNFRSMDPTTMLKNKGEVMEITQFDLPRAVNALVEAYDRMHKLTQVIQFDPAEHDYLINVALTRRALPRHIADHNMFFQRRLHIFAHFVRKREETIKQQTDAAIVQLKVIHGFIDPQEVDQYLIEMRALKPMVMDLLNELKELNCQEKVVNFPVLHLPELTSLGDQVNVLWSLFEWCKRFHEFRKDFFKRRRTDIRVSDCQNFVDSFFEILASIGPKIEIQKAAKAFSTQLKAEIEQFRHHIPVLEVMSCPRLNERHWQKMSDIVGFNLAQYANATVAQITELNLNLYVSKLKPIAFIAEREGAIADQANFITDFWTEASFNMILTDFWGIQIPSNLATLLKSSEEHNTKIRAYRDPDDKSYTNQSLDQWTDDLTKLLQILKKWNKVLETWKRVANVMRHSSQKVIDEFEEFRTCTKYFRRLSRYVDEERFVIKIIDGKHINCWLDLAQKHLDRCVNGMQKYLINLRVVNPRIALMSNGDLLKLLSINDIDEALMILQRECFPLLRSLVEMDTKLVCINIEGEKIKLDGLLTTDVLYDQGPKEFCIALEKVLKELIIKDYVKFTQHRSLMKSQFRITHVINDFILHMNTESGFKYNYDDETNEVQIILRGNNMVLPLCPDFIHSLIPMVLTDAIFTHNWALGKVPVFSGQLNEVRSRVQSLARNLLTSVRFVNCHPSLENDVFDKVVKACQRNEVLFVLENLDQLTEAQLNYLLLTIDRIEKDCARLILCSTNTSFAHRLSNHVKLFLHHQANENKSSMDKLAPKSTPVKRRRSSVAPPTAAGQRPPQQKEVEKSTKNPEDIVNDALFGAEAINFTMSNVNFALACAGSSAKDALIATMSKTNSRATWIYFDALEHNQLVSSEEDFGEDNLGYLIKSLRSIMPVVEEKAERMSTSHSNRVTTAFSRAGTSGTGLSDETASRRQSVSIRAPRFFIFYGIDQLEKHFPQISTLFYSHSPTVVPEMPPGSYLTMTDGSNFYAAKNIRFILCLPSLDKSVDEWLKRYEIRTVHLPEQAKENQDEQWANFKTTLDMLVKRSEYFDVVTSTVEILILPLLRMFSMKPSFSFELMLWRLEIDLKEAMPQITTANYGELLRSVTVQSCFNHILVYMEGDTVEATKFVEERGNDWDRNSSDMGKLPAPISQFRLSTTEPGFWVKWADHLQVKSMLAKELSLSQIYVNFISIDRFFIEFEKVFINSETHFIITGPRFCGKSTAVKRMVKYLDYSQQGYKFVFLDCIGRFQLRTMQDKLAQLSEDKKICLIIDHFHFTETCKALLEMYNDQSMLVYQNEPQVCSSKFKFILIMDTQEYERCSKYGGFKRNFNVVPIKPPTWEELRYIFEQLLIWHLKTKTFSSDYLQLAPALSLASEKIFKAMGRDEKELLPFVIRLAKSMMFAFPDNTPDLDSMQRLWCHEILRVSVDRELSEDKRRAFFNSFDTVLTETLGTTMERLFPSVKGDEHDDDDDDFYGKKEGHLQLVDFDLAHLLYSEMAGQETMDGLNYQIISKRSDFNKTLENLHFEYTKNHEGFNIDLVITDFVSDHVQRLMHAFREHNEHFVLGGFPGCGRTQCVKMAAFGVAGQIFHCFLDPTTAETFENSWKSTIVRAINMLVTANHPVVVVFHCDYCFKMIPKEWLKMLKQWLQGPIIADLLNDTVVIKMAEKMIESEKTLATLVQSSNIRLPGQRYCQFLSFEAFKNVDLLRSTLEARVADFLHGVFLAPPETVAEFEWCSGDQYMTIGKKETRRIMEKIIAECSAENKARLCETIEILFANTKDIIIKSSFSCLNLFQDPKLLYDLTRLTVQAYNGRNDMIQKRVQRLDNALQTTMRIKELSIIGSNKTLWELQKRKEDQTLVYDFIKKCIEENKEIKEKLETKIASVEKDLQAVRAKLLQKTSKINMALEDPEAEFHDALAGLLEYEADDYKKLANIKQPSLALRAVIECARKLVEKNYKSDRNVNEAWKNSSKMIMKMSFQQRIKDFRPNQITPQKLKELQRSTDGKDFKPAKLQLESHLGAELAQWVISSINVAKCNRSIKTLRKAANEIEKTVRAKEDLLAGLTDDLEYLDRRSKALEKDLESEHNAVLKLTRLIFYRERGDLVLNSIGGMQNRWRNMVSSTKSKLDNLLGNCVFMAAFRVLVSSQGGETKNNIITKWRSAMLRYNITYEEKFTSTQILVVELLRQVSWREPWPLIQSRRGDILNMIKFFYNDCNTVDMKDSKWTDKDLVEKVVRASYSDQALILFNVKSSPPPSWFELFLREPDKEKRTVELLGMYVMLNENFKLIMLTDMEFVMFDKEVLRLVTPVKLNETFDIKETQGSESLLPAEEDLLKLFTDFNAIDILESEDVTNQVLQTIDGIPMANS
ncbi:unnamed protein product [Bursaphelenchus xylophilus]|uniref:(pine wood nematode) hypothetical protein n=1 Tax=Bursaphelenchus xylophilus TaxID=6326 RepID=A0A1I7RZ07_BURXY|nr:unnamed protein product [Bursaphelenchus xylophilus]CAG9106980.1 unnamed protein product [Bursaphelenchus xylophilus]